MSTNYNQVLDTLVSLITTQTGRTAQRSYRDPSTFSDAELLAGLYLVVHDQVAEYPYEHRPGDIGRQQITVIGLCKVAEDATGEDLERMELAMTNEMEQLAETSPLPDELVGLTLLSVSGSMQLSFPHGFVMARFSNYSGA